MSNLTEAEAVTTRPTTDVSTAALRNLYAARFTFAIAWAGLLAISSAELNPFAITLLVLYPLADLGAAVYDFRSSGATRQRVPLLVNMALSLATAVGLGVAIDSGLPDVLRVWGAWAITAGAVQLVVASQRRGLGGGQWPMILSGGISVLAGGSFVAMASGDNASLSSLAGYAALGGIFSQSPRSGCTAATRASSDDRSDSGFRDRCGRSPRDVRRGDHRRRCTKLWGLLHERVTGWVRPPGVAAGVMISAPTRSIDLTSA
ncbi:hypothetical protein [Nocardioides oleivorans]|uniref:hypothetical protein n=1 Tax=Nocardioides oleivorans TaxID=273676 RepID=UPI001F5C3CF4|nr:hypothetical protein [Nocardioides oleivorans]